MTPTPPQRIQLKRTKGWRKPDNTVVVARPSLLGNPFRVIKTKSKIEPFQVLYVPDPRIDARDPGPYFVSEWPTKLEAIADAVDAYRDWATSGRNHYLRVQYFLDTRGDIAGANLACWCPLDQPCHADVLLELANPRAGVL